MIDGFGWLPTLISAVASGTVLAAGVAWVARGPALNARTRFVVLWFGLMLVVGLVPLQLSRGAALHEAPDTVRSPVTPTRAVESAPSSPFPTSAMVPGAAVARIVPDDSGRTPARTNASEPEAPLATSMWTMSLGRGVATALAWACLSLWLTIAVWRLRGLVSALVHVHHVKLGAEPWPGGATRSARLESARSPSARLRATARPRGESP